MKTVHTTLGYFTSLLLVCTSSLADDLWLSSLDQARQIARETNKPILCHFYADWCGPCRQMERQVFPSQDVRGHLANSVVPVKIDIKEAPHLANRFGVTSLPMDIVLEPNGDELVQSIGFKTSSEYSALLNRAHTRYSDLLASRAIASEKVSPEQSLDGSTAVKPASTVVLMLNGYCPVTLWKSRRWEKGSVQFQADYKGQRYQFASSKDLEEFNQSPERYVPQFLGCDPVVVWETDRAVSGSIQYGAFYDERLYLFTTDANRSRFKASPDEFIKTQVVLNAAQIERVIQ